MTSLQTTIKSVSRPRASSGLTTACCEASPSPVSPTTIKETSSRSACRSRIKSLGSCPASRCISIQRRRSSLVGSPRKGLRYWLRDCQRGTGVIQENDGPPANDMPSSLQRHPAPASDSREEPAAGSAPAVPPLCLSPVDNPDPLSKKPSGELVGELTTGVVFLHELHEPREVVPVQPLHIRSGEALAELPQVRAGPELSYQLFGGCVVLFEAARVVADEVYPRAATIPAGADQGTVVSLRREPHLEERVGQTRGVHLLVEPDKAPARLEGVLERDRELQFLMQVVDGAVEGPVALQHEMTPQTGAVGEGCKSA